MKAIKDSLKLLTFLAVTLGYVGWASSAIDGGNANLVASDKCNDGSIEYNYTGDCDGIAGRNTGTIPVGPSTIDTTLTLTADPGQRRKRLSGYVYLLCQFE